VKPHRQSVLIDHINRLYELLKVSNNCRDITDTLWDLQKLDKITDTQLQLAFEMATEQIRSKMLVRKDEQEELEKYNGLIYLKTVEDDLQIEKLDSNKS